MTRSLTINKVDEGVKIPEVVVLFCRPFELHVNRGRLYSDRLFPLCSFSVLRFLSPLWKTRFVNLPVERSSVWASGLKTVLTQEDAHPPPDLSRIKHSTVHSPEVNLLEQWTKSFGFYRMTDFVLQNSSSWTGYVCIKLSAVPPNPFLHRPEWVETCNVLSLQKDRETNTLPRWDYLRTAT